MKRLMLVLPFLLAACDSGVSAPTENAVLKSATLDAKGGTCTLLSGKVVATGFDEFGYNRCAHNFNGTYAGWCKNMGAPADCGDPVAGTTKLIMKWNEEWDRGKLTGWKEGPYDAYLDNEARGNYLDGTPFSEHFKTRWDVGCANSGGAKSTNGGDCIWGSFEILMDQGKEAGVHNWWAKLTPAGYGN